MPRRGVAAFLVTLAVLVSAAPALGSSDRVRAGFYGVNFQRIAKLGPAAQNVHLASIASLRIDQVRFNVSWAAVEPVAPKNGVHNYRWGAIDQQIAAWPTTAYARSRPSPRRQTGTPSRAAGWTCSAPSRRAARR